MIGYGVLLECLDHPEVTAVTTVGRRCVDLEQVENEDICALARGKADRLAQRSVSGSRSSAARTRCLAARRISASRW